MGCCNNRQPTTGSLVQRMVKTAAKGAVGLTKVALRVGIAKDDIIKLRRDRCRVCEFATKNADPKYAANNGLTNLSRCTKCHCNIKAKTQLVSEHCPVGQW